MTTRAVVLTFAVLLSAVALVAQSGPALPLLSPPSAATFDGWGGSAFMSDVLCSKGGRNPGVFSPVAAWAEAPSNDSHCRLKTSLSGSQIADHYGSQLTTQAWTAKLTHRGSSLAFTRYLLGTTSDPFVGVLMVVPFPKMENAFVSLGLTRATVTWPMGARGPSRPGGAGGAGARGTSDVSLDVNDWTDSEVRFPRTIKLPADVGERAFGGGGGSVDSLRQVARFHTNRTPADLMKIIEPQIVAAGWTVDVRVSDPVQSVTKFNPPAPGDSTAILMLTSMPGMMGVDLTLHVVRNRR